MNRIQILKSAKRQRKRGLSVRDFNYWDLEDMVHESLLHKSFPRSGRGAGWPCYKISKRGLKALQKSLAKQGNMTYDSSRR